MVRNLAGRHLFYFEAVLQLREVSQEVVDFVEERIANSNVPLTKTVTTNNGFDLYLADGNFTKALGRHVQIKFGGELVLTSSLHTRKNGKDIYRHTVLIRGLPYKKGDTVVYKDADFLVKVLGKEIIIQNKLTGKMVHVKYKVKDRIKKKEFD